MSWSVSRAARETGLSKSTISRAIKSGRISAAKQHDGSYLIEPAELFRVYPRNVAQPLSDARHDAVRNPLEKAPATISNEIELLKLKLAMTEELLAQERENSKHQQETVQDLRKRLDAATDKVLALARPTQPDADAPLDASRNHRIRRLWWRWKRR
jgi:hypothetical protein